MCKSGKLILVVFVNAFLLAQPKISGHLELGFYQPDLTGFESNELFPSPSAVTENILLGYGFYYQFYPNARIGYASHVSMEFGNLNTSAFSRTLIYREIALETFYRPWKRIELNFSLAPMYNSGKIKMTTDSSDQSWDELLVSFGNSSISAERSDEMTASWFGFASAIGVRFYIFTWMGIELKMGFMENYYKSGNWEYQNEKVTGPELKLEDLPVFSSRVVFGW